MRRPDVFFSPVPHRVVDVMLEIADVREKDVVYDLGSGDGRILIAAAQKYGARGVGVDLDLRLLADSRVNARGAGVEQKLEFLQQDFFATDLRPASVVALYLLDSLNIGLRPKILSECRPGTRVVSYSFEMGEWEPDEYVPIAANGVMLWIVPANLNGTWKSYGSEVEAIALQQKFQKLTGTALINGKTCPIQNGMVSGASFTLTVEGEGNGRTLVLKGNVQGATLEGTILDGSTATPWKAQREEEVSAPLEVVLRR